MYVDLQTGEQLIALLTIVLRSKATCTPGIMFKCFNFGKID